MSGPTSRADELRKELYYHNHRYHVPSEAFNQVRRRLPMLVLANAFSFEDPEQWRRRTKVVLRPVMRVKRRCRTHIWPLRLGLRRIIGDGGIGSIRCQARRTRCCFLNWGPQ